MAVVRLIPACGLGLALVACSPAAKQAPAAAASTTDSQAPLSQTQAEKDVAARFDARRYVLRDFIPKPGAPPPAAVTPRRPLHIGLYWVMNDETTPWYVAKEKGYFSNLGLDVDFIEGGPNRDNMTSLLANRIDIYVGAAEVALFVINSRTGTDLKMICATAKETPVGWIGIDHSIPSSQRSTRVIGAEDLAGKKIGIQPGADYLATIVQDQLGLPPDSLKVMTAGATPDALMAGAIDYYQGFGENQPRVLERNGIMNWTFFPLARVGYHDYFDVSIVTADFYHQNPEALACYVYALSEAIQFETQHPEEAADIAVRYTPNYPVTKQEAFWRIQRDLKIYAGDGSEPILAMNPAVVQKQLALLYRYHQIELAPAPAGP